MVAFGEDCHSFNAINGAACDSYAGTERIIVIRG
jgi:hypothetical protein